MASAETDDARYNSWPSYMNKLRQKAVDNCANSSLNDVNRFVDAAKRSKVKDCISWAYYYKVFYLSVVSPDINNAEATVRQMEREKMNGSDINMAKFDIIYYYQISGNSAKAVALCREILNTTHDKSTIAEANYNILLLYQNLNMFEQAAKKAIDLCKFSENITEKKIYHYSLANFYSCAADYLIEIHKYKQALRYLQKCDSTVAHDGKDAPSIGNNDMRFTSVIWCKYYLGINDDKNALKQIKKLKSYGSEQLLANSYELATRYYLKHREFAKAKTSMDSTTAILKQIGQNFGNARRTLMCAQIARGLGDYQAACTYYDKYIAESDSLNRQADEFKTSEYMVQLNLNKVNLEKSEYKSKADHYRLQLAITFIIVVFLVLIAAFLFIFYLRRINRKLHRTNDELQKAYENVDNLNNMKTTFFQNMSHEIRTPLNSIVGFSQLLSAESEENKQYASIINENSFYLIKIVENVLEISDVESSIFKFSPTNVNDCCEEAMKNAVEYIRDGVEIIYRPTDKGFEMQCDKKRLVQLLTNLLDNALKFTKEGNITLSFAANDEKLHLSVTDTGPGVPPEKAEWVFERFAKLDDFILGSGLGLSVCRMIAEKLHGSISIDKDYHSGCKVDVWLPIASATE
jgi:signal transduction histidine kinase